MPQGIFITLEGIDGARTRERALQLYQTLSSLDVKSSFIECPSLTQEVIISATAASHFLSKAIELYILEQEIEEKISVVDVLISHRYSYYQLAYAISRGISLNWGRHVLAKLKQPDVVLFLDACVKESLQVYTRQIEGELTVDMQQEIILEEEKTYLGYISLIAENPTRYTLLDCRENPAEFDQQLEKTVLQCIESLSLHKPASTQIQQER